MNEKLTIDELMYVQEEVKSKGKRLGIAYLLTLLFGFLGIHLGYLERTKSAVIKALLTISTVAAAYPVSLAAKTALTDGVTMQLQQYSSAILVLFATMLLINLVWTMYDLVSLPTMVKKVNDEVEARVTTKTIQARYVAEQLRKDEVSEILIKEISERVTSEIDSHIQGQYEIIKDKVSLIDEDLMQKREDTIDLIENITSNLSSLKEFSDELNEEVDLLKDTSVKDIETLRLNLAQVLKESQSEVDSSRLLTPNNSKSIKSGTEPIDKFKSSLESTFTDFTSENEESEENSEDEDLEVYKVDKEGSEDFSADEDPEPTISKEVEEAIKDEKVVIDEDIKPLKHYELSEEEKALKIEEIVEDEPEISSEDLQKLVKDLNDIVVDDEQIESMERLFARGSCDVEVMDKIFSKDDKEFDFNPSLDPLNDEDEAHESVTKESSSQEENINSEEIVHDEIKEEIEVEVVVEPTSDSLTVNQALIEGKGQVSVEGFIVGYMSPIKHNILFDEFDGDMNIVISDSPEEKDVNKMITVQLTWDSKLRDNFGLLSNPGNLSKRVIVKGDLSNYFEGLGIKKVTSIELH